MASGVSLWENIRARIHQAARLLYHLLAVIYIMGSFLVILNWNPELRSDMIGLGHTICQYVRYAMLLLVAEQFLRSPLRGLVTVGAVAAGWVAYVNSEFYRLVDFLLFFLVSDLADERQMAKMFLWTFIMLFALQAFCMVSGFVETVNIVAQSRNRNTLGFGHPNTTGAIALTLIILAYILFLKKQKIIFAALCFAGAAFSHFVPDSRTVTILLILLPFALQLVEWISRTKAKKLLNLAPIVPWVFFAVSFAIVLYIVQQGGKGALSSADGNMMARFTDPARQIRQSGYTLFGTKIPSDMIWDNVYMNLLLQYGIVPTVITLSLFSYMLYRFVKNEAYGYATILMLYMLYGVMEACPIHPIHHFIPFIALSVSKQPSPALISRPIAAKKRLILSGAAVLVCVVAGLTVQIPGRVALNSSENRQYDATSVTPLLKKRVNLSQSFAVHDSMQGFRALMATYTMEPTGIYAMDLLDEEGELLEEHEIPGEDIHDNGYLDVYFDRSYPAGNYTAQLRAILAEEDMVSVWQRDGNPYAEGTAMINNDPVESDWVFNVIRSYYTSKTLMGILLAALCVYTLGIIWMSGRRKDGALMNA